MSDTGELFWRLLEPEYVRAMMFCRKLMGDREQGDDLFQDSLVLALERFETLRDRGSFRPWLYRIMTNLFTSKVRRRWWKRLVPLTLDEEEAMTSEDLNDAIMARRLLQRVMRSLSASDRVLITLHELEGWPVSDLVGWHGKTEAAVKARLFRARGRMRRALMDLENKARAGLNADQSTGEVD